MRRGKAVLLLLIIVLSTVVSLFSQVERVMAVTAADASPEEKVFAYTYMRAMQNCFANSRLYNLNSIPIENANKGEWFTTAPAREKDGYPLATGAAKSCADTDFVKKYMSIFGYPTGVDALGDNGLKMTRNSESEFTEDGKAVASRLPATVAAKWGTTPAIDAALDYVLLKSVLGADAGCRASATSDRTLASGSKGAVTKTVSGDGEVVETLYYWGTDVDDGTKRTVANTPSYGKDERTCQKIADDMSASAAAYVNTFPVQSCDVKYKGNDAQINACKDGEKHPDESTYCQTTYPNGPSEPGTQLACLYGQKRAAFDPGGINGDDGEDVTSCQIEAIGWIICPVVRFLAKTTDASYSVIRRMMTVPSSILDTSNANSVYQPWQTMRNLANISFITVFLFIIYSHLTSAGISNYTLKKMLPKLIVGALLVNLSFWICGGLVELSNVIGENIYKVVGTAADSMYPPDVIANTSPDAGVWNGLTTAVLMGTGIAGVAAFSSFAILIPLLLSAALAIVTVLVVLTVRQALIVVMVMIAPLAFVAYMLPNTEGLFKKWWGLFKSLLLLYPVVSMVFAGSALASLVLTAASNSPEGPASGDLPGFTLSVMGAAVSILPLFITPILMKTTSGVLGQVTGMVNNKNRGMIDRSKKFAGEKHQEKYNNALANGAPNRFGRGGKWNPLNRAASRLQRNRYNSINRKSSIAASNAQLEADALAEPEGQDAAKRNITAQKTSSVNQNAAKQAWLENHDNEALELQAEVSELNVKKAEAEAKLRLQGEAEFTAATLASGVAANALAAAESKTAALADELKTSEAAAVATHLQAAGMDAAEAAALVGDLAPKAQAAATELYVQKQRAGMAERLSSEEVAKLVENDAALQDEAGGVHPYGESLAVAQARQVRVNAFNTAVTAEKTKLSQASNEKLLEDLRLGVGTREYQAAVAGTLMSRNERKAHLKALDIIATRTANAESSGDKNEMDALGDIQQQMYSDMKDRPFALSDSATGQLQNGTLGRQKNHEGKDQEHIYNLKGQLAKRTASKLSAKSLATMDPDEVKSLHKLAREKKLAPDQLNRFQKAIQEMRSDENYKGSEKPEIASLFDEVLSGTYSTISTKAAQDEYDSRF
ncbi:hypothetical protein KC945_00585 [Candidatus Saccharibacteria bacterium]|nr:hypothetical protein [Candidatus Saccharibacteria bacterium]